MKPPLGHGLVFEVYELHSPPEWRWRLWDARNTVVAVSGYGAPTQDACLTSCDQFAHDVALANIRLKRDEAVL